MNPRNAARAIRAHTALVAYKGKEPGSAESAEMIIDLLTDLHHMMNEQHQIGIEELLDEWLRISHDHFNQEKKK